MPTQHRLKTMRSVSAFSAPFTMHTHNGLVKMSRVRSTPFSQEKNHLLSRHIKLLLLKNSCGREKRTAGVRDRSDPAHLLNKMKIRF